jgi:hypothetical protein
VSDTQPVSDVGAVAQPGPTIRLFVDLSDGISRTYDVTRYVIESGVLRLFAAPPERETSELGQVPTAEIEVAAFAVGGWLRVERDLTGGHW